MIHVSNVTRLPGTVWDFPVLRAFRTRVFFSYSDAESYRQHLQSRDMEPNLIFGTWGTAKRSLSYYIVDLGRIKHN